MPTFRADNIPYGGLKDSGFGREGVRFAMEECGAQVIDSEHQLRERAMKVGRMFINGKWKLSADGATREIFNPANNEVIAVVAEGGEADAERAIAARARPSTKARGRRCARRSARPALQTGDLIDRHAEELAKLETRNNGKPLREAKFDVADAAECFRYYAGLITKPLGPDL